MSGGMIIGIVSIVLTFGIAVFVHELGHYLMARLRGVGVEAFAIGMGPKIVAWTHGGTEYSIRWLPVGGFVRLHQMVRDEEGEKLEAGEMSDSDGGSKADSLGDKVHVDMAALYDKGLVTKLLVFGGGVFFNFLTAIAAMWMLYTIGFMEPKPDEARIGPLKPGSVLEKAGIRPGDVITEIDGVPVKHLKGLFDRLDAYKEKGEGRETFSLKLKRGGEVVNASIPAFKPGDEASETAFGRELVIDTKPIIGAVIPYTPAERAGIKDKDEVIAINIKGVAAHDEPISQWEQLQKAISSRPGEAVELVIRRAGVSEPLRITVVPEADAKDPTQGRVGIMQGNGQEEFVREGFLVAGLNAPKRTWNRLALLAYLNYDAIRNMTAKEMKKNLGGPVAIGRQTYKVAQQGFVPALQWFINLNLILAIMNLLPIPVLDGGFIIISLLEAVARRPIPARIMGPIYSAFALMFISFALLVTYWDILRTIF